MDTPLKRLTAEMVQDAKIMEAPRSGRTQSGYGQRLPTQYMVRIAGRWHRVYMVLISNAGSAYVRIAGARYFLSIPVEDMLENLP